jgi:glutamate synthase domain-containing protein 2/glutamate synthase domain-containing protein 3
MVARHEAQVLILSDRAAVQPGSRRLPLPMVLLTSALHSALSAEGRRRQGSIVVDSGEIQEGHDAALLLANGADAVHPHLLYRIGASQTQGGAKAVGALARALDDSIRRIMSKMGICSVAGYRGSRLFEAVGIQPDVVDHYLPGVTARLGGLSLEDIYTDLCARRSAAGGTGAASAPAEVAIYRKEVWNELQTTARGHDPQSFDRFLKLIAETPPVYLRDLLRLRAAEERGQMALPVDEVATEQQIVAACLRGAAMSLGALHRVAHGAIAAAFNELGSASNSGEGGEDPRRDKGGAWESQRSRIRQVASGRFGVEARYLVNADELSIKIGQGAKPGEGGMLPAEKVTAEVARIRKTQQGVTLISPPPHHDIYSIEDLAQLIHNLRQCHPGARVSVKIPAVTDIGTIAVGIAKAGADVIDISGFEGGTGAAAASSIEHAGLPLERALTEAHQALWLNGIRDRVRLRADGGIKTGFDVMAVLALGADEVSLGTALMIAEQCIFCHGCANGMCPAGITTQSELVARRLMTLKKGRAKDEDLPDEEAERFEDARQGVLRYLRALAGDMRRQLAALGLRHPAELVGRVDLLERRAGVASAASPLHARMEQIDLAELLADPSPAWPGHRGGRPRLPTDPTSTLNASIVARVAQGQRVIDSPVRNTDHAVGATLAGQLAQGRLPVPTTDGPITLRLSGYAGQALGFACVDGMRVELTGFANDTAGEAMSGGVLVVRPPRQVAASDRRQLSTVGNALAYGATGGRIFVEGRAGQRVGVRNSGATLVVEGAGKYAFEYMTGGVGVVLGSLGPVVGSGLTGGVLYLLDEGNLRGLLHPDVMAAPLEAGHAGELRALLEEHAGETGSAVARALLDDWTNAAARFLRVCSRSAPKVTAEAAPPIPEARPAA